MLTFSPEFIDLLASAVAKKVVEQIEAAPIVPAELEAMKAKYGEFMDRSDVAQLMGVSAGTVKNMEKRGKIFRADVPTRSASYRTEEIYQLVKPR